MRREFFVSSGYCLVAKDYVRVPQHMADDVVAEMNETEDAVALRIYEVGYHITPDTKEEELEKVIGVLRAEIEKSGGEEIFKSIGPILVKTSKEAIKKDLEEGREEAELKVKALEKQEIRIKQKIKSMQERFQALTQGGSGG